MLHPLLAFLPFLLSAFPVHSTSFPLVLFKGKMTCDMKSESDIWFSCELMDLAFILTWLHACLGIKFQASVLLFLTELTWPRMVDKTLKSSTNCSLLACEFGILSLPMSKSSHWGHQLLHCSFSSKQQTRLNCNGSNLPSLFHCIVLQVGQTLKTLHWIPFWQGFTISAATTTLSCWQPSTYWHPLFRSILKWANGFHISCVFETKQKVVSKERRTVVVRDSF